MKTQTSCIDDETLAAFIDGRLAETERRIVIEHLADCEDCYDLMAEALRSGRALAEEEIQEGGPHLALVPEPEDPKSAQPAPTLRGAADSQVAKPMPEESTGEELQGTEEGSEGPRSALAPQDDSNGKPSDPEPVSVAAAGPRPTTWNRWVPLAAALAALGLGVALFWPALRPRGLAGELSITGLPEGWADHTWAALTRADATPEEKARAFRAGVHHMDLEVALENGELDVARTALANLLRESKGFVPFPSFRYERLSGDLDSGAPSKSLKRQLQAAQKQFLEELGERSLTEFYRWGAWAEAGRLAQEVGDASFFQSRAFRAEAAELLAGNLDEPTKEQIRAIRARSGADPGSPEFMTTEVPLKKIFQRSGRPPYLD